MKDGKFETHREMLEALLSGKKVRNSIWESSKYIHMMGDNVVTYQGLMFNWLCFGSMSDGWELYIEQPKDFGMVDEDVCSKCMANFEHDECPHGCEDA